MPSNLESIDAEIIALTHDGQGLANLDGQKIFIPGALPGELVRVVIRRRKRRYREAQLVEVLSPAASRVDPPCAYFGRCGGCTIQHLNYETQVKFKHSVVREALLRIAGIEPREWLPPITGPEWHYRRRARLGVRYVLGKERVLVGFKERATRYITDMASCRVLVKPADALPELLARLIDKTTLTKRLPQVEIAVGELSQAAVFRVLDEPSADDLRLFSEFGWKNKIDIYLQRGGPGTVQALDHAAVRLLTYTLPEFDIKLEFTPTDFVQINANINAAMVCQIIELLDIDSTEQVLDLYCGLGNFSLPIARRSKSVLGVEGEAGLVARAAHNARLNGIKNAQFGSADLSKPDWSFLREAWDLVLLDPPRSGAYAVVKQMKRMGPRHVAYVSCHPATLARDAKELVESQGYRLHAVGIADMFPHTSHVEVMALFERA